MNEAVNAALTDACVQLAQQRDIPFARRVRVSPRVKSDIVVRRNSRVLYLHPSTLEGERITSALTTGIRLAHELDFQSTRMDANRTQTVRTRWRLCPSCRKHTQLHPTCSHCGHTDSGGPSAHETAVRSFQSGLRDLARHASRRGVSRKEMLQVCVDTLANGS